MRLWVDTESVNSAGRMVRVKLSEMTADIDHQVKSRATRALNELRNAELEVLKGQRSGKVYRKYPYKVKYRASTPGEPPARRTGALRLHWDGDVEVSGGIVKIFLESQERYAGYLEKGTPRMAPRPFHDTIIEGAMPGIKKIYKESYR